MLDISDDTEKGRTCRVAYDVVRQRELRAHPWNFAIVREVLAPETDAPAFGYDYAYNLPAACLRVLRERDGIDWRIEGRQILTDEGPALNLRYVSDFEDTGAMDAMFVEVLAAAIAAEIAGKITQSSTKVQIALQRYKEAVSEARRANAFENAPIEPPVDSWLLARL